jgi:NAD(P)-dependent dehydrogenase (short-subunit alcohol dehydrogenase family)
VTAVTAAYIGTTEIYTQHYADDEERIAHLTGGIPSQRMTTPTDVGESCLFLASSLASNVYGANLLVHGGGDPIGALPERPAG